MTFHSPVFPDGRDTMIERLRAELEEARSERAASLAFWERVSDALGLDRCGTYDEAVERIGRGRDALTEVAKLKDAVDALSDRALRAESEAQRLGTLAVGYKDAADCWHAIARVAKQYLEVLAEKAPVESNVRALLALYPPETEVPRG